jgi:hypothetical protein
VGKDGGLPDLSCWDRRYKGGNQQNKPPFPCGQQKFLRILSTHVYKTPGLRKTTISVMKATILTAALILTVHLSFGQDYMDVIAEKSCECLNNLSDTLDFERFQIELGLCMINAAEPYKKQLKKDHKIDFAQIELHGEELGELIGAKMTTACPDALLKLVDKANEKKDDDDPQISTIEGRITTIVEDKFVEFSIKDESGKTSKYYWLTSIKSKTDLAVEYKNLVDKPVVVAFLPQEIFDARIGEYRTFYVIQSLEVVED